MAEGRDRRNPADRGHQPNRARSAPKNTKRWCRGKVGVEHQPQAVMNPWGWLRPCGEAADWWRELHGGGWRCHHQIRCTACGKVLTSSLNPRDCPDRKGAPWP